LVGNCGLAEPERKRTSPPSLSKLSFGETAIALADLRAKAGGEDEFQGAKRVQGDIGDIRDIKSRLKIEM
jgi:hypothetical protein